MEERTLPPKIIFAIVERNKADETLSFLKEKGLSNAFVCYGEGTVKSEIANMLGLEEIEKEIIISIVSANNVDEIMNSLEEKFGEKKVNGGVAFSVSLTSIAGASFLKCLQGGL